VPIFQDDFGAGKSIGLASNNISDFGNWARNSQISKSVPIHISSCGEIEGHPRFDFMWFRNRFVAIFRVDFNNRAPLSGFGFALWFKNNVEIEHCDVLPCPVGGGIPWAPIW